MKDGRRRGTGRRALAREAVCTPARSRPTAPSIASRCPRIPSSPAVALLSWQQSVWLADQLTLAFRGRCARRRRRRRQQQLQIIRSPAGLRSWRRPEPGGGCGRGRRVRKKYPGARAGGGAARARAVPTQQQIYPPGGIGALDHRRRRRRHWLGDAYRCSTVMLAHVLAVGETVIVLTPPVYPY